MLTSHFQHSSTDKWPVVNLKTCLLYRNGSYFCTSNSTVNTRPLGKPYSLLNDIHVSQYATALQISLSRCNIELKNAVHSFTAAIIVSNYVNVNQFNTLEISLTLLLWVGFSWREISLRILKDVAKYYIWLIARFCSCLVIVRKRVTSCGLLFMNRS